MGDYTNRVMTLFLLPMPPGPKPLPLIIYRKFKGFREVESTLDTITGSCNMLIS